MEQFVDSTRFLSFRLYYYLLALFVILIIRIYLVSSSLVRWLLRQSFASCLGGAMWAKSHRTYPSDIHRNSDCRISSSWSEDLHLSDLRSELFSMYSFLDQFSRVVAGSALATVSCVHVDRNTSASTILCLYQFVAFSDFIWLVIAPFIHSFT